MKKYLFILISIVLLIAFNINAQVAEMNWVSNIWKGANNKIISKNYCANQNAILVAGSFKGGVKIDQGTLYANQFDGMVCKYDSIGRNVWAKSIGGNGKDYVFDVAESNDNSIYAVGSFEQFIDFDNGPGLMTYTANYTDGFLLKMNQYGLSQWVIVFADGFYESANCVEVDKSGNIYITGIFGDTVDFDPGPGKYNMISTGQKAQFICKYSSDGKLIWANSIDIDTDFTVNDIASDEYSNLYLTGISGKVDYNPGSGVEYLYGISGVQYIIKLDKDGNFIWANQFAGTYNKDDKDVLEIDIDGNLYTTGIFWGSEIDFDPGPGVSRSNSNGGMDVFVKCLDENGDYQWHTVFGGTKDDNGRGIAVDSKGNVYVTGDFESAINFASWPDTLYIRPKQDIDVFNVALDQNGEFIWSYAIGGNGDNIGYCIDIQDDRNLISSGSFDEVIDFDPGPNMKSFISSGESDIYLHSIPRSIYLGLNQSYSDSFVEIAPNPNNGSFILKFENHSNCELMIFNSIGMIVYSEVVKGQSQVSISLPPTLKDGMYIVRLIGKDISQTQKLVLKKF